MDDELTVRIAEIYYESSNFANQKALAKIKASIIYFWINIVQTKCMASN